METLNLVSSAPKAVTSKASNVTVSTDSVIAQKVSNQSMGGQALPEEVSGSQSSAAQKIEETVSDLNSFVQNVQRSIQFSVHDDTGRSVITVTDKESGDVIRNFPSEDVLAMAAYLAENKAQSEDAARGLLVNESA
ncbi:flagellar protein FlaG [Cycloclasticus zancles]|jgi:flagellar protein FlaG|uniref:Flagellin protein FlaG n=1 Tax=Cycloclasticus zancles 78-ME TaxID=1198232 RepID=S5T6I7_9GAMM|nr:flagellar protein FlaG [Cycloclasticus zancles]AGS39396.1 Flagellin protein FlaG [Cycloclasticus zancles 78-ME]